MSIEAKSERHALGHRMKRKEDPRFLQGKGNYVDDISLPGMLYASIVRSPVSYTH
jgi:carbon-monoxide dehydrogenase large subunit